MANTLAVAFDIDQPAATVEISTNSGTTWAALTVPASGTHKSGNLLNVPAGTYAIGVIQLRAVSYPASMVSNTAPVTIAGAATGAATQLAAPANTSAVASGATAMSVTASSVPYNNGYKLYRSTASTGTYTVVATIAPGNPPTVSDGGLTASTTYFYQWQTLGNSTTYTDSALGVVFSGTTAAVTAAGPSPTIASFTPAAVVAGAGTTVTVTGTNLTGATAVALGATAISGFVVVNSTTVTFTVPTGATGAQITITTPNGTVTSAQTLSVGVAQSGGQITPGTNDYFFDNNPASNPGGEPYWRSPGAKLKYEVTAVSGGVGTGTCKVLSFTGTTTVLILKNRLYHATLTPTQLGVVELLTFPVNEVGTYEAFQGTQEIKTASGPVAFSAIQELSFSASVTGIPILRTYRPKLLILNQDSTGNAGGAPDPVRVAIATRMYLDPRFVDYDILQLGYGGKQGLPEMDAAGRAGFLAKIAPLCAKYSEVEYVVNHGINDSAFNSAIGGAAWADGMQGGLTYLLANVPNLTRVDWFSASPCTNVDGFHDFVEPAIIAANNPKLFYFDGHEIGVNNPAATGTGLGELRDNAHYNDITIPVAYSNIMSRLKGGTYSNLRNLLVGFDFNGPQFTRTGPWTSGGYYAPTGVNIGYIGGGGGSCTLTLLPSQVATGFRIFGKVGASPEPGITMSINGGPAQVLDAGSADSSGRVIDAFFGTGLPAPVTTVVITSVNVLIFWGAEFFTNLIPVRQV